MILVFGSTGLLGSHLCKSFPKDVIPVTHEDVDINHTYKLERFITQIHPDVVINCAGVVRGYSVPVTYRHLTNTVAPKKMAAICEAIGIRMVHVSTDCVFDGSVGKVTEKEFPSPEDLYGSTKLKGEVVNEPHLTVRASFIGLPDRGGHGLASWLKSQKGLNVQGYTKVKWNGMTALALASILVGVAYNPSITGLRHVYCEDVSKFDVLTILNDVYGWNCNIIPIETPVKDMRLRTVYNDIQMCHDPGTLREQVVQMKEFFDGFTK